MNQIRRNRRRVVASCRLCNMLILYSNTKPPSAHSRSISHIFCCLLLLLITSSSHSTEQHGCHKSAKWAAARKTGNSAGTVWHFGKSISTINNLIIVRTNRWSVHTDERLGSIGAERIVAIVPVQGRLVVQVQLKVSDDFSVAVIQNVRQRKTPDYDLFCLHLLTFVFCNDS